MEEGTSTEVTMVTRSITSRLSYKINMTQDLMMIWKNPLFNFCLTKLCVVASHLRRSFLDVLFLILELLKRVKC